MPNPIRAEQIIGNFTHVEDWHEVGTAGEPVFENSWVNFDTDRPARFYKDPLGIVHLSGLIKTGSIGTVAFTLPEGYRPDHDSGNAHIATASNSLYGELVINTDGSVKPSVGSNAWFSLFNISFKAA